jgi:RNA polymerase sigma factor (sigma-70 family)
MSAPPRRERREDRLIRWRQEYLLRLNLALRARGVARDDLDDAIQSAWLKAYVALRDKPPFQSTEDEFRWLQRVAIRAAIDHSRKRQCENRHLQILSKSGKLRTASNLAGESEQMQRSKVVIAALEGNAVMVALESLRPSLKQVVAWRYFDELTFREIADRLGLSRSTVRKWHAEALRNMRNCKALQGVREELLPERTGLLGNQNRSP